MADDMEETAPFIEKARLYNLDRPKSRGKVLALFWTTIFLAIVSILEGVLLARQARPSSSYEAGFATDLASLASHVGTRKVRFDGEVEIGPNGSFYIDPQQYPKYVGPPDKGIDMAWDELLSGLNLDLDSELLEPAQANTYMWEGTETYFSGIDVLHSLHCLNRIRQAFHPQYYFMFEGTDKNPQPDRQMHVDHCIDHIRQSLQCHSDLTPMEWTLNEDKLILKTNTEHTCRDFSKIHEWVSGYKLDPTSKVEFNNGLYVVD